jgi:hypothetical protein
MRMLFAAVHHSAVGTFETLTYVRYAAAFKGKPDVEQTSQKGQLRPIWDIRLRSSYHLPTAKMGALMSDGPLAAGR